MKQSLSKHKKTTVTAGGQRKLRIMFDNTNEHGICMLDGSGRVVSWNLSAERLMGYTSEEVLGKNYSVFFSEDENKRNVSQRTLAHALARGSVVAEGIRLRKDATHFWGPSFLTRVKDSTERAVFFVLITQDVSERRALEQRREEYIGIASHELKTPITTLSLYSELLAKRLLLDNDKKNLQMMRDIQGQAARLVTLVDDLLVVSKIEHGSLQLHKETFDIHELAQRLTADLRKSNPDHTIILTGRVARKIRADKPRIGQVFINLMNNALKYSFPGSAIRVRVGREGKRCVVSVTNKGPLISKADQRHIFTRFFRSSEVENGAVSGSGLGLYISKTIIAKHRGSLVVKSSEDKGTTFTFTLPFA